MSFTHTALRGITALMMALLLAFGGCNDDDNSTPKEWQPVEPKMEKHGRYTVVWLKGTPYEMGYQHGEMLYDVIAEAMVFVENDEVLSLLPEIAKGLGVLELGAANSYQDVLDECQGMIDATQGTGFTMDFCMALNFGDVMMELLPSFRSSGEQQGPGCTEVLANGAASPDGRLYHARNLDWGSMDISIIHSYPVIFVRQPDEGIPHMFMGFPLNITPYTGMNAAGLSVCSNEADPLDATQRDEVGRSHVQMLGQILKHNSSLDEAKAFLEGEDHMSSEMIVVADGPNQTGAVFEMTAKHMKMRNINEDGYVYAVNHFLSDEMKDWDAVQDIDNPDSSILRHERLQQVVDPDGKDTLYGQLNIEGLAKVMRDRVNPRTGIEPPYDEENIDNDAGIATNGPMHFVLFDPQKLLFWVSAGQIPIDKQPYVCFSLGELLGYEDAEPCPAPQID